MIGADGQVYGPYSMEQLQDFISQGRITYKTQIILENGKTISADQILNFNNDFSYDFSNKLSNPILVIDRSLSYFGAVVPYYLNIDSNRRITIKNGHKSKNELNPGTYNLSIESWKCYSMKTLGYVCFEKGDIIKLKFYWNGDFDLAYMQHNGMMDDKIIRFKQNIYF